MSAGGAKLITVSQAHPADGRVTMIGLPSSEGMGRLSRATLVLVVCGALIALALSAGAAAVLFNLRINAIEDSERELRNMVLVLSEQTDRTLQSVELIQTSLVETTQRLQLATPSDFRSQLAGEAVHVMLQHKLSGL